MDKSDWAFLVSSASALFAGLSVLYVRKMAINDGIRMKRKPLVFEVSSQPCTDYEGWHEARITIRNFEPVSARVRKTTTKARRTRLLPHDAAYIGNSPHTAVQLEHLPEDKARRSLDLQLAVDPVGHDSMVPGSGPTKHISIFSTAPVSSTDLSFEWEWVDGAKS
ncbi:hypothetical protein [uncultured Ruegeria sp.]|uniref:hypothetical protein n=1 Tax=uncultured Ruegeria sp. TaxID=259304 RepID=UPI00262C7F16|nr:hypothetical protein [uncultured Ruegeria sp.]